MTCYGAFDEAARAFHSGFLYPPSFCTNRESTAMLNDCILWASGQSGIDEHCGR